MCLHAILPAYRIGLPLTMITSNRSSSRLRRKQGGAVTRLINTVRDFLAELTSSYHPERHYMRGGGTGGAA
jgi:hypothetical protein